VKKDRSGAKEMKPGLSVIQGRDHSLMIEIERIAKAFDCRKAAMMLRSCEPE